MRIGHGFDVHRFAEEAGDDNHIFMGGVKIAHPYCLLAHSDGDVLLHAACDALLGAAALGDIGRHFPDSDERYRGIDSRQLLRHVCSLLAEHNYTVVNLDSTIVAQSPKMAPHIEAMRANLAQDMGVSVSCVNVKATTTEQLGYTGRKEGIAVHCVVLLEPRSDS